MLIEILKEPVRIDGKDCMKDVRLNIVANHQLRFKAILMSPKALENPVDIVIYNWTIPKLEKLSISISIDGKEMLGNIKFDLKLSYDFFKKLWRLRGDFGVNPVNKEFSSVMDIFTIIREYL